MHTNYALAAIAREYLAAGLCVLPADAQKKYPQGVLWTSFQDALPTENVVDAWFRNPHDALCLVTGAVSGNLELLDFDCQGLLYDAWFGRVAAQNPELLARLYIETSPSGGWHVVYRSASAVCKNLKLAQRMDVVAPEEIIQSDAGKPTVERYGKLYQPTKDQSGNWRVLLTLIETRGEGGLFLCAPSVGYTAMQGDLCKLPVLTESERELLLSAAWELNEYVPPAVNGPTAQTSANFSGSGTRPGDDFNARGDVRELLVRHGWTMSRAGDNEHWCRPGKTGSTSATLKDNVLYVFSTSTAFEANRAYSPFAVYAILEHGGNYDSAARALRSAGFGSDSAPDMAEGVDLSGLYQSKQPGAELGSLHPLSLGELVENHPHMRKPVIHGLLREGETMNVIAASKTGKSWLVIDLALSIATGGNWLGMPCEAGNVLLIDNELHCETSANRIPKVAAARGIPLDLVANRLYVQNLRGKLQDIFSMRTYFQQFEPGSFKVVILDAFYRFLPKDSDENDNGTMANIFNCLDSLANELKCCFVLIHHTSKGNQSQKDVTDVGAGAGAQSRATDTHLVLRRHEEEDAVVLDAAVRSWPPLQPRCLRWNFPIWVPDDRLDPSRLHGANGHSSSKRADAEAEMSVDEFVEAFFGPNPISRAKLQQAWRAAQISDRLARRLLDIAIEDELVFRWQMGKGRVAFATEPQPEPPIGLSKDKFKGERVREMLINNPHMGTTEIAAECDVTIRYVQQIAAEIRRTE